MTSNAGKMKTQRKDGERQPIRSGSQTLALLRTMLFKREHLQQKFAMLLLREVKELRANETSLLSSVAKLEAALAERIGSDSKPDTAPTDITRSTGDAVPNPASFETSAGSQPTTVVAEPVASLLGACGKCGECNDGTCDAPSAPNTPPRSVLGRSFVVKIEEECGPPPGYKRCFLCAHSISNKDCALCTFRKDQDEDNAVAFATALQKEQEEAENIAIATAAAMKDLQKSGTHIVNDEEAEGNAIASATAMKAHNGANAAVKGGTFGIDDNCNSA